VLVRITSSTADFVDTSVSRDAQALFNKLTTALTNAAATDALRSYLRTTSSTYGAASTAGVNGVTLVSMDTSFEVVSPRTSNDVMTEGEYAGVVIGVLVVFAMLIGVGFILAGYVGRTAVESV
jgi:hypothetical protein